MHSTSPQLGVGAAPDRQRRAPVAVAAERPVDVVLQPFAEAAVLDVLGVPADRLVVGQQLVLDLGGGDVPARGRVVEQRRAAAPAVRVGVLVALLAEEQAAAGEVGDQRRGHLRVLDEAALEADDPVVEVAVGADRVVERLAPGRVEDPALGRDPVVVLAEGGGDVDQAGPVLGGDEIAGEDLEGLAAGVVPGAAVGEREDRAAVAAPDQVGAGEAGEDVGALPQHLLDQRLGEDQDLAVDAHPRVRHLRRDRDGDVAGQRPGGRRPDQQRLARLGPRPVQQREPDVDRGVLDVSVAERDLVRGERRAVARAVGDDLVALVEAALVPVLLQRPPDRLDVVVLEGHVGVVEVDPEADPLGQPVPLLDVLEDRLAAALVELGDPELLDLLLGGDPQLLFDLELDRQPVAVPAGLARHPVAAHRAVAGVDVLEDAGEDVVGAGAAVGGRRALVEAPDLGALAVGQRALEDFSLAPALEHPLLEVGEGLLRVDWLESGHEPRSLGVRAQIQRLVTRRARGHPDPRD